MKKFMLFLTAAILSWSAAADEGMWLLPYLQKMNRGYESQGLPAHGRRYLFGESRIAPRMRSSFSAGLYRRDRIARRTFVHQLPLRTFDIQGLSSEEHDYLKDGFWAMSNEEEIPAPGLTVRFVREIIDVTPRGHKQYSCGDQGTQPAYLRLRQRYRFWRRS